MITERFIRAGGPGGQNVNKVATAVELRYDIGVAPLPEDVKTRLRALAGQRLTSDDVLVIVAQEHRTQGKNREAARARLEALLARARQRPRRRRPTAPSRASKEARISSKKRRATVKMARARRSDDE